MATFDYRGVKVTVADEVGVRLPSDYKTPSSEETGYSALKVADLKAELERRNAERDEDAQITVEGTGKNGAVLGKDIAAALEADDAASDDDA